MEWYQEETIRTDDHSAPLTSPNPTLQAFLHAGGSMVEWMERKAKAEIEEKFEHAKPVGPLPHRGNVQKWHSDAS